LLVVVENLKRNSVTNVTKTKMLRLLRLIPET